MNEEQSIVIPYGVSRIRNGAFLEHRLINAVIPSSVEYIEVSAFRSNKLTHVTIPDSVKIIADFAFADNQLMDLVIGKSVTSIGDCSFKRNYLTSVTIPDSVTSIGRYAFASNQLMNLVIGKGVTSIDQGAFEGNCLTSVTIPSSVTNLGWFAFGDNPITKVTLNANITTTYESYARPFNGHNIQEIIIGDTVTTIPTFMFKNNKITSLAIPNSVKRIGHEAFWNNPIHSLAISDKLEEIYADSIDKCQLEILVIDHETRNIVPFLQSFADAPLTKIIVRKKPLSFIEKARLARMFRDCDIIFDNNYKQDTHQLANVATNIHDNEIKELIAKIRQTIEPMDDHIEQNVVDEVKALLQEYKQNGENLKPELSFDQSISLETTSDFDNLRMNLVIKLQRILNLLSNQVLLSQFLIELNDYQHLLSQTVNMPENVNSNKDKVQYILAVSQKYKNKEIVEQLKLLLENTNRIASEKIQKSIAEDINLSLENEQSIPHIFSSKLDNQLEIVKNYDFIQNALNSLGKDDLSKDIISIQFIVSLLDEERQTIFQSRLDTVKSKWDFKVCSNQSLESLILSIRKELQPILEELGKIVPYSISIRDVLNELNNDFEHNQDNTLQGKGAITEVIQEIIQMIEGNNIPESEKLDARRKLTQTVKKWKERIINQETFTHEERFQNLSDEMILQLQILKELYQIRFSLQTYIQNQQLYEEQIRSY